MARFDERDVFSALLARGELGPRDVDGLAQRLAASHRHAPRRPPRPAFGTAASVGAQLGAALDALEPYADDPRLADYQPYWAARADLLARAGATAEALGAYDLAIGLERDPAARRFLQRKRMALSSS